MNENKLPLEVCGLCKHYDGFDLKDVSFSLQRGTITGFVGRNGAGKTTTINAILSFIHKDDGQVHFDGQSLGEDAVAIKRRVGFASAGMTYYPQKKLKAITSVVQSFYTAWDEREYHRLMNRFSLNEEKTPASLSNGMKLKYALALALSHGAELLILDEPASGLDPVSREELNEIFLSLRDEGKTLLFSTHITSDLEKCADRVIYIRRGMIAADMTMESFRDTWRVVDCPGEVPDAVRINARGLCRVREGHTALIRKEDMERVGMPGRLPTLDRKSVV